MNYLVFYRENDKFDDLLKDPALKKKYKTKIRYRDHLILGFSDDEDDSNKILSYIMLRYGDDMIPFNKLVPDRTPVPNVDYVPIRKKRR